MSWCLIPKYVDIFKKAIISGEVDPFKIADMESQERRDFLEKYVGKENAQQVNALYESKLLLKNQQSGMISWVKRVAGIKPQAKRDIITRIEGLENVLSPKEGERFFQDLASVRLRLNITQEEAENIAKLSKEIRRTKANANPDGTFDTEEQRLAYGMAKVNMENYINQLKIQSRKISFKEEPLRAILNAVGEIPAVTKSLVASLDNSFWGRQGIKSFWDYKTTGLWTKNFLKSWTDLAKQLTAKGDWYRSGDDSVMDMIRADIYSRPGAITGKYRVGNYQLDALTEEAFPTSLPERIPVLGRLFKASEVAYNGGALRLRADLADRLIAIAEENGVNTLNRSEAQALGHLVGSMTGRGSLNATPETMRNINTLMFSIRFLKSNIDTLTAHYFDGKATPFARKQASRSLARIATTLGLTLFLVNLFDDDAVEEDPRSTNFGKVKIFGHWVDISGGMASLISLVAKTLVPTVHNGEWGLWRKSSTGKWTNLIAGKYGQEDAVDVLVDSLFLNKLSPITGIFRDALRGEMFGGEPFTLKNAVKNLILPLSIQNAKEFYEDPNTSFLLGSIILEGMGLSVSTYRFKDNWNNKETKEMSSFKDAVGQESFDQANRDYERAYNIWYEKALASDDFRKLSDEDQANLISKAKDQIKEQVMREFNFKYKERKTPDTEAETKKRLLRL